MPLLLPILFLLTASLSAQELPDEEKLNREAAIEMLFRNPRSPMAKLDLKAVDSGAVAGRKTVAYSVAVSGLPQNQSYILMTWDIGTNAPVIAIQGIRIDESGVLRCGTSKDCLGGEAGAALLLKVSGMIGQPRRFILTASDKKPLAMGEAIPFPAIGRDNQCTVEAVLLRPNASVTLMLGEGFVPGEDVKRVSSSRGETIEGNMKADESGKVLALVLPFVKGYEDGQTSFTYRGSKCRPSTTFSWGAYREEEADSTTAQ